MPRIRPEHLAVAAATLLVAAFAAAAAHGQSMWYDEGVSLAFAQLDWQTFGHAIRHLDGALAAYYALLHVWLAFGHGTFAVRSLSIVAAAATVPLLYAVAARLFGRRAAVVAAVLGATSPLLISFGSDARPYALVGAFSVGATLLLLRLIARPGVGTAAAYAACALVMIYLHALAGLLVAAHVLSLAVLRPARPALRPLAAAFAAILVGSGPLALLLFANGPGQAYWIAPPRLGDLAEIVVDFTGSRPAALVALVAVAFAVVALRRSPRRPALLATAIWVVVPLAALYLISLRLPLFITRYVAVAAPPLLILAAAGIAAIPRRAAVAAVTLVVALLGARTAWSTHARSYEDYRAAAALTGARAGPSDAVVVYMPGTVYAFREALDDTGNHLRAPIVFPAPNWQFWTAAESRPPVPDARGLAGRSRVWLVMRDYRRTSPRADALRRGIAGWLIRQRFVPAGEADFTNVSVVRFDRESISERPGARQRSARR